MALTEQPCAYPPAVSDERPADGNRRSRSDGRTPWTSPELQHLEDQRRPRRDLRSALSPAHAGLNGARVLADTLCVMVAFLVAAVAQPGDAGLSGSFALVILLAPVAWVPVLWKFGLYPREPLTSWDEFRRLLSASTVGVATIVLASVWLDQRHLRSTFVVALLAVLTLELFTRSVVAARFSPKRGTYVLSYKTLIIGTNDEAGQLARTLAAGGSGFTPLGYVAASGPRGNANGLHVLGEMDELAATIRAHGADCVFVASTDVDADDLAFLTTVARREQIEIRISASLPDILASRVSVQTVGHLSALSIRPTRLSPAKAFVKRASDVVMASGLLLLSAPISIVVAMAVRLTSRGPVLFKQERVTKGGELFRIYKFRTMFDRGPVNEGIPSIDATRTYFKMKDDPRLTPVGRFLRRYSLDELPQLWNVIRGDISLVGPRPLWSAQVDLNNDIFRSRNEVRAGLTGWWQINGRSGVEAEEALRMDLFYVENWSLLLDLYILLRTIPTVLRSNAY